MKINTGAIDDRNGRNLVLTDFNVFNVRANARQIFNAAKKKKLITTNPVEDIDTFGDDEDEEPHVLDPEQWRTLLAASCEETRLLYAIAAYAGVRWGEIAQMTWEEHIRENEIVITADIAKKRSRRTIEMSYFPALLKEFASYRGRRTGSVLPRIYNDQRPSVRRLDNLRAKIEAKAGLIPWQENWLRHSFISYFYASTNDEKLTSRFAGNSPDVVHTDYKAIKTDSGISVTKEAAERYFAVA